MIGSKEDFKLGSSQTLRKVIHSDGMISITNGLMVYDSEEGESSTSAEIRSRAFNFTILCRNEGLLVCNPPMINYHVPDQIPIRDQLVNQEIIVGHLLIKWNLW